MPRNFKVLVCGWPSEGPVFEFWRHCNGTHLWIIPTFMNKFKDTFFHSPLGFCSTETRVATEVSIFAKSFQGFCQQLLDFVTFWQRLSVVKMKPKQKEVKNLEKKCKNWRLEVANCSKPIISLVGHSSDYLVAKNKSLEGKTLSTSPFLDLWMSKRVFKRWHLLIKTVCNLAENWCVIRFWPGDNTHQFVAL